ncbi:MAG: pyridoxal phosphate-dependent aminotransferase, partial [Deltaproteobacteria bacterium]|nr:pyridoxal phosphate-dependent aminotransferase [Deltaproteobacteria bacterium]
MKISQRTARITPSITLGLNARALELERQGMDLVKLGVGEPDIDTPETVCDAGRRAIDRRELRYTPTAGTAELRRAVCGFLKAAYGMEYTPAEVMASSGAKHSLFNAVAAMTDPGDEVIIPAPYWVSYPEMVAIADGIPRFVETPKEHGFKLRPELLEAALTPRTAAIFLNSPSNPTGVAYTRQELEALAEVLRPRDIWVLSDEIYGSILFDGFPFASMARVPGMRDRTVVVNGVSKTFSMTGWRIGFAAGPEPIIKAMTRLQDHTTSCPSALSQAAAASALAAGPALTTAWVEGLQARRDLMLDLLREIPGMDCPVPQGAFYLWADVRPWLAPRTRFPDTLALCEHLLLDA